MIQCEMKVNRLWPVLVHREMEFCPIGVSECGTTSYLRRRGIVPRRFVASVPISERSLLNVRVQSRALSLGSGSGLGP